jgi:hypothetical protein
METAVSVWKTRTRQFAFLIISICTLLVFSTPALTHTALIDNGDGTITDTNTGLMWLQNANESGSLLTWDQANDWIDQELNANNFAGHSDWRLPTGDSTQYLHGELWTLFIVYKAFLNDGEPFLGISGLNQLWTATEDPGDPSRAMVSMWAFDGNLVSRSKSEQNYVWAVRTIPGGAPALSVDVWLKDYWGDGGNEPSGRSGESVDIFIDNDGDGRIDLPRLWWDTSSYVAYNTVKAYLRNKANAWVVARAGLYRWNCETRSSFSDADRYDTGEFRKIMLPPQGRKLMVFPDVLLPNKAGNGDNFCLGVRVIHDDDTGPNLPAEPRDSNNLASARVSFIADREGQEYALKWIQRLGGSWMVLIIVAIVMTLEWLLAHSYYRKRFRARD